MNSEPATSGENQGRLNIGKEAVGKPNQLAPAIGHARTILFVHHGDFGGGAPFSMLYTAQIARDLGYTPRVLLLNPSAELYSLYREEGFEVDELTGLTQWYYYAAAPMPWWRPSTYKQLLSTWRTWDRSKQRFQNYLKLNPVDVVHLNSVVLINLAEALRESNQRFVWHVREHGPPRNDWRLSIFRRHLLQSPEVIFLSNTERRSWIGESEHGTIVHNFVPADRFNQSIDCARVRHDLSIEQNKPIVLYVGGIRAHKGGKHFLRAMKLVKHARPDLDFVLVLPGALTDDPDRNQKVRDVVSAHGLLECSRLLPFLTDIDSYIAAADLLVFPSRMPHFARPVVEAAAMRTPVVVSDLPPMNEFLSDGKNAWVAKCGNDRSLAGKVLDALSDTKRLQAMGEALHEDFRVRFSVANQSRKLSSIYQRVFST